MTNETRHTPTPWDTMGSLVIRVEGPTSYTVARASSSEDAAHIVKCVNMHDELVEALLRMKQWCEDEVGAELPCSSIDKVLKKAGAL